MIILGIDPGSILIGYGAISAINKKISLIEYGVIKAKLIENEYNKRLGQIYSQINTLIDRVSPDVISLETMFYHKNAQSLIKLSQSRAAVIISAVNKNIDIVEYSPREVKKSVAGRGNSSKQQVQFMVRETLSILETPEFYDCTDALSLAICHFYKQSSGSNTSKIKSWADYINQNPDKVIKP
ncbi:MAG: crossover junction endodeoxyribonuclease RuvC [Chloroherpetonaceae bacterium]|nr:crossover junction endodeoxyribonuclease RuvC [bacterium]HAW08520.1 crossover junction endodeoxyribonuclease RuvC [Bacteroidota bacterium]